MTANLYQLYLSCIAILSCFVFELVTELSGKIESYILSTEKNEVCCTQAESICVEIAPTAVHRAAAYYQLFFCNEIVISNKTYSKCQFSSKKAKVRDANRHKTAKLITFLLQKNSPKTIV